ncbi:MAG: LysR family transcriptional regulator [Methanobacteriaceae archaeon]|uniref:LysR family transcriptional regulator n=1 Tax=Methanobrevibacter TaxID=2172 RepID=UPI002A10E30B|nr:LysR family transcriptional regulator [Methanobacteriaceae archaeon]MDD3408878.1 LysR family transcriptional regulator [Methanobacteriaceae archaeon]MDD4594235.1 LysR family transcriptional regulator [Methanobacteriaceae archaeon]
MNENNIKPKIELDINGYIYNYKLFESLKSLQKTQSIRKTSEKLNLSHSALDRKIKNAENKLGFKLVKNNYGSGSTLTKEGLNLIKIYNQYQIRLKESNKINIAGGHIVSGLLESISNDIPFDISVFSSDDESAFELGKRNLIDILALDDPLIGFQNNLDFTAIGYDYLTLVSNNKSSPIKTIEDLNGKNFVSVKGSAQRLVWDTLKQKNVEFNIKKEVKSQFDAFKIVKNNSDLYTFLNASYFHGNDILKVETNHIISLIQVNDNKKENKEFIDYMLNKGQNKIFEQGFKPIKPWKIN